MHAFCSNNNAFVTSVFPIVDRVSRNRIFFVVYWRGKHGVGVGVRFCGAPARGGDADLSLAIPTDLGGRCCLSRVFIAIAVSSKVIVKFNSILL